MTIHKNYQSDDFHYLSNQILIYVSCYERRMEFLEEVTKLLHSFTDCDAVELWIMKNGNPNIIEKAKITRGSFTFNVSPICPKEKDQITNRKQGDSGLSKLVREIFQGHYNPTLPFFTKKGSFFTCNTDKPCRVSFILEDKTHDVNFDISGEFKSIALIPLIFDNKKVGLLQLMSSQNNFFNKDEIELFEHTTLTLSSALLNQRNQEALSERVKELTCLYRIAKIAEQKEGALDEIFNAIIKLLPPAWQYPEITSGRIIFDGRSYSTEKIKKFSDKMTADLIVTGRKRGSVEVIYLKKINEFDDGPFLQEERSLLNTIAENIALIVERKEAFQERLKLQNQLMHADRLATIGQLSAGVAHEINEPLGNILGLAQLAIKYPEIPKQIEQDLSKIIAVTLDAREIIKHLMLFSRQKLPEKTNVNLNQIVNEGLVFFESRCRKEGIELVRLLTCNLPEIIADRSQIHQVIVNLITNAIQSMPKGGKLTIQTDMGKNHVSLIMEDTGSGISDEVKKQMFNPFFTTKEFGQGTGIGLSIVHGIITSHNGMIKVESQLGIGTRFEIQLPLNDDSNK